MSSFIVDIKTFCELRERLWALCQFFRLSGKKSGLCVFSDIKYSHEKESVFNMKHHTEKCEMEQGAG